MIRTATEDDVPAIVAMVHELAEYERAPEECHLTEGQLITALFVFGALVLPRAFANRLPARAARSA